MYTILLVNYTAVRLEEKFWYILFNIVYIILVFLMFTVLDLEEEKVDLSFHSQLLNLVEGR